MANIEQIQFDETPKIINEIEPHLALLFLLDTSNSMGTEHQPEGAPAPIQTLNESLNRFRIDACKDEYVKAILDVAIVEFNSDVHVVQDFCLIEYRKPVELFARGQTVMSPAIRKALEMVNDRSRFYRACGNEPYKPWVMLISDGLPSDDISDVIKEIKEMEELGKVSFRSLGVGEYCEKTLHTLSGPKVMKLEGSNLTEMFPPFTWFHCCLPQEKPGERPQVLDLERNVNLERNTDWDV